MPTSTQFASSPALKKPRIMTSPAEEINSSSLNNKKSSSKSKEEQQEEDDLAEAIRQSLKSNENVGEKQENTGIDIKTRQNDDEGSEKISDMPLATDLPQQGELMNQKKT